VNPRLISIDENGFVHPDDNQIVPWIGSGNLKMKNDETGFEVEWNKRIDNDV
jgi:hypothetical protein